MDRELSNSILEENLLKKTRSEAHRLWKFLEYIYEDDEDQEEEEKSLDEHTTVTANTHPSVTPHEDQGARTAVSAGSLLELVRPVLLGGSAK